MIERGDDGQAISISVRMDNSLIINKALKDGAVWICDKHPDVLISSGSMCSICGV